MWTKDRRSELIKFQRLIAEVKQINRGSNVLERIQECIDLAKELSDDDMMLERDSFVYFLSKEARQKSEEPDNRPG